MTGNYSAREYRDKLYDDLHVRLSDTVILMCAIFIASIGSHKIRIPKRTADREKKKFLLHFPMKICHYHLKY